MTPLFIPTALCALFVFFSCTKEGGSVDPDPVPTPIPTTPVAMQGSVGGIELETRAGATTETIKGHTFAVYAINYTKDETAYGTPPAGERGEYTVQENGTVLAVTGSELWLVHQRARIYAAFPAGTIEASQKMNAQDTVPRLVIPTTAIRYEETAPADANRKALDFADVENDYMYGMSCGTAGTFGTGQPLADNGKLQPGEDKVNEWGPTVRFGFRHAFARIRIILKRGQDYNGSTSVTKVAYTRTMPGIGNGTRLNLHDGMIEGTETAASRAYSYDLSRMNDNKITTTAGDQIQIESYALPCSEQKETDFAVTVDGKEMELRHTADVAWVAGKIYVYTLSVKGTGLAMTGISIEPWTAGASTGDVEI